MSFGTMRFTSNSFHLSKDISLVIKRVPLELFASARSRKQLQLLHFVLLVLNIIYGCVATMFAVYEFQ